MTPTIIKGASNTDFRGTLFFNNEFDATEVKRIYVIKNKDTDAVRAWRGHRIEKRWFTAIKGSFRIQLIAVDNWDSPTKNLERMSFILHSDNIDILCIPPGYVSSIQSLKKGAKLLVMANYLLGELQDEYRYEDGYFE